LREVAVELSLEAVLLRREDDAIYEAAE